MGLQMFLDDLLSSHAMESSTVEIVQDNANSKSCRQKKRRNRWSANGSWLKLSSQKLASLQRLSSQKLSSIHERSKQNLLGTGKVNQTFQWKDSKLNGSSRDISGAKAPLCRTQKLSKSILNSLSNDLSLSFTNGTESSRNRKKGRERTCHMHNSFPGAKAHKDEARQQDLELESLLSFYDAKLTSPKRKFEQNNFPNFAIPPRPPVRVPSRDLRS